MGPSWKKEVLAFMYQGPFFSKKGPFVQKRMSPYLKKRDVHQGSFLEIGPFENKMATLFEKEFPF